MCFLSFQKEARKLVVVKRCLSRNSWKTLENSMVVREFYINKKKTHTNIGDQGVGLEGAAPAENFYDPPPLVAL